MDITGNAQNGTVSGRKKVSLALAILGELDMERREWKIRAKL